MNFNLKFKMMNSEKRIIKFGIDVLAKQMTKEQAYRYGERNMPKYLKRVGFKTIIFTSSIDINGELFYRINYGK